MDKMMIESSQANWHSLGQSLKQGNVIPVIGPGALEVVIEEPGQEVRTGLFYRLVAEALLGSFGFEPPPGLLDDPWALHRAVSTVLEDSPRAEQKIRREVARLIDDYANNARPAESLELLAGIGSFSLFVSLTPDNLLERALRRCDETGEIRVGAYSPRDASESVADLILPRQGECGVFQLFGSCANVGGFAMHEEDALEYLFRLQSDAARRFTGLLSELRRRDLLFIGCGFPDWLGRAMLRLVNENRLSAKDTQEFLCPGVEDPGLNAFLSRYSPNTLSFPGSSGEFIKELALRFGGGVRAKVQTSARPIPAPSPGGPTVFVSYASQNAEAAQRIANTLLGLGYSDVWLDKKKLIGGDDWSNRIEEAIEKSDFFLPVLSREADGRREGVFWDEWKCALKRSRRIKDAYLLPVGVDPEPPSKNHYQRISVGDTAEFFDKHLIHAPGGVLSAEDRESLCERCRRFREENHV